MSLMKKKVFLMTASLALTGFVFSVEAQEGNSVKPMDVEIQSILSSCDAGVPAGYVLVKITRDGLCGNVGRAPERYHFESYFDKPVGSTMTICRPYPPPGWYVTGIGQLHLCGSTDMYVIYRES